MSPRFILIVEDSPDLAANLEIACAAIDRAEVKVALGVAPAWGALKQVAAGSALVIVTDLHLPDDDGIELIERVRNDESLKATPVLVVSGESDPGLENRLHGLEIAAFYRKPYSPLAIRQHVELLLDRQQVSVA